MNSKTLQYLIFLVVGSLSYQLEPKSLYYKLHLNQQLNILQEYLTNAQEMKIENQQNITQQPQCQIHLASFILQQEQTVMIKQLALANFDPLSQFQEQSFISFVHIEEGIVAITSEFDIYIYQKINQEYVKLLQDNSLNKQHNNGQLPQLFYCKEETIVLIVFDRMIKMFQTPLNVSYIQIQDFNLNQTESFSQKARIYKNHLFIVAEQQNIDLYKIQKSQFIFVQRIEFQDIKITDYIIENDYLYISDDQQGIKIIRTTFDQNFVKLNDSDIEKIYTQKGAGKIAAYNNALFVIFENKTNNLQQFVQYQVDKIDKSWEMIGTIELDVYINNIFTNKEFLILQGFNIQIIYKLNQLNISEAKQQRFYFEKVRQLDFIKNEKNSFQFIGMTKNYIFIKQFQKNDPFVSCFTDKSIFNKFFYTIRSFNWAKVQLSNHIQFIRLQKLSQIIKN